MTTCFYHPKSESVGQCMGCKNSICATCRQSGAAGFCAPCMKRLATLGSQIDDVKKTGMVQSGGHKATMLKTVPRAAASENVVHCFQHFDVAAQGDCPSCNRSFCKECLDASGMCTHCARHAMPAAPRKGTPTGRLPAVVPEPPERPRPVVSETSTGLIQPTTFFVFAVVVFLLIVAYKMMG